MKTLFSILLISLLSMQLAFAQTGPTADQLLAAEILNSDDDPTNDVADASTITNAGAVISAAPAASVQAAITAVSTANPAAATAVAAAGASNNTGVSVAQAASSAGVTSGAVFSATAGNLGRGVTARGGTGTGSGSGAGGGSPGAQDLEAAILANPDLIGEILPGLSQEDVDTLIAVVQGGGTIDDFIGSGAGGTI